MAQERNKKKAKNWLHRFLEMKHRLQDRSNTSEPSGEVCLRREAIEAPELRSHRNSFRRSLKRMHTRVKSCMFPQETNSPAAVRNLPVDPLADGFQGIFPEGPPPPVPERPLTMPPRRVSPPPPEPLPPPPMPAPIIITFSHRIPTDEIATLTNCCWYWGPMTTSEAEAKLRFKADGTFLVRDSSSTSYLFSISFRSVGKTMHARIEYSRGKYNLCGTHTDSFPTITELIEDAMRTSENGIYCYSRRGDHSCEFPVRLTKPVSRFINVKPLRDLCKFVIRHNTNISDIPKLPLPTVLHKYLVERPFF